MKTPDYWINAFQPQTSSGYPVSAFVNRAQIEIIQSDARQDLAEQVTKLQGQLKEAVELLEDSEPSSRLNIGNKIAHVNQLKAFLASLDQREEKGRKTN